MSLKNITDIKLTYYTLQDNITEDLILPSLEEAVTYKRAVAFFSSKVLLKMTHGLWSLAKKGGRMQLLVSPKLETEDYEAIKRGYDLRNKITSQIIEDFDFSIDFDQKDARFSLLAYMIATGLLEIKIVLIADKPTRALFHRKTGIFIDLDGNEVSFAGSGNDTESGYDENDEQWDVSATWFGWESQQRCMDREASFNSIWENTDSKYITIPFPEVIKNKLLDKYSNDREFVDYTKIDENYLKSFGKPKEIIPSVPGIPSFIKLTDFQSEAVENWVNHGYRGIFDMATGSGKTYAAAGAICRLYKDKERIITIVCCPTTTLVEQWYDELIKFNIEAIRCYSGTDYEKKLNRKIEDFRQGFLDFVCIITTNATFQKDKIQSLAKQYTDNIFLLVDEAHNFGGNKIIQTLNVNYPYRLALSATFERMGDKDGTDILYDFFGEKCIVYDTDQALADRVLCRYYYHVIPVSLSSDEYDEYIDLSKQYAKRAGFQNDDNNNKTKKSSDGKYAKKKTSQIDPILLKRARLIASVSDKVTKLKDVIVDYKNQGNMLVYCGDPYVPFDDDEPDDSEQVRQIDKVASILNEELDITSIKFTASEDKETRQQIINEFKSNKIQAIVAIKCLDEGIDIPAIKTAFILASTTNPRQYIQRRGRLLRQYPGKEYAEIYDFVVLPRPLETYSRPNGANWNIEKSLVRKELKRVEEFARLSQNMSDFIDLTAKIRDVYDLDNVSEEENEYADV